MGGRRRLHCLLHCLCLRPLRWGFLAALAAWCLALLASRNTSCPSACILLSLPGNGAALTILKVDRRQVACIAKYSASPTPTPLTPAAVTLPQTGADPRQSPGGPVPCAVIMRPIVKVAAGGALQASSTAGLC